MNQTEFDIKDLNEFLSGEGEATVTQSPPSKIANDLVTSRLKLSGIYILGAFVGYIASLVICAQCGVGLSPVSWKIAQFIHSIPDPWCPILCGVVFGISPTLVSSIYLSRFQHRFLVFQIGWLPAIVPVVGTMALLATGDSHSWEWRSIWFGAAILTPYLVEIAFALMLRQRKWQN
ncbi:MAG: hypothetical protein EOP04_32735 [Proteobacteria bacterium]|nr:MAG: hypothetical protein EOP04_32735 [Pseudomonadota bacterium]